MNEDKSSDKSNDKNNNKSNDRWAIMIGAIGLLAIALLLLPPFPPWLRVVAVVLAVLVVLMGRGILPRLRATWQRSLSDLPSDEQHYARWSSSYRCRHGSGSSRSWLPYSQSLGRLAYFQGCGRRGGVGSAA
jgi:hypothetical protein